MSASGWTAELNWTKLWAELSNSSNNTSTGEMWKDSNQTGIFAILCSQLLFRLRQRSNIIILLCVAVVIADLFSLFFSFSFLPSNLKIQKIRKTANNAANAVIMFGRLLLSVCLSRHSNIPNICAFIQCRLFFFKKPKLYFMLSIESVPIAHIIFLVTQQHIQILNYTLIYIFFCSLSLSSLFRIRTGRENIELVRLPELNRESINTRIYIYIYSRNTSTLNVILQILISVRANVWMCVCVSVYVCVCVCASATVCLIWCEQETVDDCWTKRALKVFQSYRTNCCVIIFFFVSSLCKIINLKCFSSAESSNTKTNERVKIRKKWFQHGKCL